MSGDAPVVDAAPAAHPPSPRAVPAEARPAAPTQQATRTTAEGTTPQAEQPETPGALTVADPAGQLATPAPHGEAQPALLRGQQPTDATGLLRSFDTSEQAGTQAYDELSAAAPDGTHVESPAGASDPRPKEDLVKLPVFPGETPREEYTDFDTWKIPKKYEGKPEEWRQHKEWLRTSDPTARLALTLENFDQQRLATLEFQRERYAQAALARLTPEQRKNQNDVDKAIAQAHKEATEIVVLSGLSQSVFHRYDYYAETARKYSDPLLDQALAYRDKINETLRSQLPDDSEGMPIDNRPLTYQEALAALDTKAKEHWQEGTTFNNKERENLDYLADPSSTAISSRKKRIIEYRVKTRFLRAPYYVSRAEYKAAQTNNDQKVTPSETSPSRKNVLPNATSETKMIDTTIIETIFRFFTNPAITNKSYGEFVRLHGPLTSDQLALFHAYNPSEGKLIQTRAA